MDSVQCFNYSLVLSYHHSSQVSGAYGSLLYSTQVHTHKTTVKTSGTPHLMLR